MKVQAYVEIENGYRCYWQSGMSFDQPPGQQDVLSIPRDVPRVYYKEEFGHFLLYAVEKMEGAFAEKSPQLVDIKELDIGVAEAKSLCLSVLRERFEPHDVGACWIRRLGSDDWFRLQSNQSSTLE